mmetsp:Transcript_23107/g.45473  ORF Transcript_23107/g.45473 Transcript_23107/m.45473 type:complete len:133 (-) Transcript_23107:435-833(-)
MDLPSPSPALRPVDSLSETACKNEARSVIRPHHSHQTSLCPAGGPFVGTGSSGLSFSLDLIWALMMWWLEEGGGFEIVQDFRVVLIQPGVLVKLRTEADIAHAEALPLREVLTGDNREAPPRVTVHPEQSQV